MHLHVACCFIYMYKQKNTISNCPSYISWIPTHIEASLVPLGLYWLYVLTLRHATRQRICLFHKSSLASIFYVNVRKIIHVHVILIIGHPLPRKLWTAQDYGKKKLLFISWLSRFPYIQAQVSKLGFQSS